MTPSPSLEIILQQGLLGAVCVLLIFVSWQIFKLYAAAQQDKIQILREALQAAAPLAEAIRELTHSHKALAEKVERMEDGQRRIEDAFPGKRR